MILLLCFAFTGQTMASIVMSYHMVSMKGMSGQVQPNNMSMMDHSSHSMASDASSGDTEKSSEDCCDNTCNCFTGGCSSVAVLIWLCTALRFLMTHSQRLGSSLVISGLTVPKYGAILQTIIEKILLPKGSRVTRLYNFITLVGFSFAIIRTILNSDDLPPGRMSLTLII